MVPRIDTCFATASPPLGFSTGVSWREVVLKRGALCLIVARWHAVARSHTNFSPRSIPMNDFWESVPQRASVPLPYTDKDIQNHQDNYIITYKCHEVIRSLGYIEVLPTREKRGEIPPKKYVRENFPTTWWHSDIVTSQLTQQILYEIAFIISYWLM